MIGNPGCGKSMLASRITGILPSLNTEQAIASASLQSLSTQGFQLNDWAKVPFAIHIIAHQELPWLVVEAIPNQAK